MSVFNRLVALTLPFVPKPIVGAVAKRYIAGESLDEALKVAEDLNRAGFLTALDLLGEDTTRIEQASQAANDYSRALDEITTRGIDAYVSIKPTQFGLKVDPRACLELIRSLSTRARSKGQFVRIEMEDSSSTSETIELFRTLRGEFSNVGIVIQAYLRRSVADISAIADLKPNVRIVKGVYVEPRKVAFKDPRIINRNYVRMAEELLRKGAYVAFATHDELLVWEAFRMAEEMSLPKDAYEFQMLLGVQDELRDIIRDAGHRMRVYIPYGKDWYPYSVRRLRENPEIAGYVMRAMLRGE